MIFSKQDLLGLVIFGLLLLLIAVGASSGAISAELAAISIGVLVLIAVARIVLPIVQNLIWKSEDERYGVVEAWEDFRKRYQDKIMIGCPEVYVPRNQGYFPTLKLAIFEINPNDMVGYGLSPFQVVGYSRRAYIFEVQSKKVYTMLRGGSFFSALQFLQQYEQLFAGSGKRVLIPQVIKTMEASGMAISPMGTETEEKKK
ncbi:MAG: hypothetical protein WC759_04495 [Candidatus Micrarchaeia archaeon]|jgi:hypothetical protein